MTSNLNTTVIHPEPFILFTFTLTEQVRSLILSYMPVAAAQRPLGHWVKQLYNSLKKYIAIYVRYRQILFDSTYMRYLSSVQLLSHVRFFEVPRIVKILESESTLIDARFWGDREGAIGSWYLMRREFQFRDVLGNSDGKESACQCRRPRFNPWVGKIPWRRAWQPTPIFLPGKSYGQRSLAG